MLVPLGIIPLCVRVLRRGGKGSVAISLHTFGKALKILFEAI